MMGIFQNVYPCRFVHLKLHTCACPLKEEFLLFQIKEYINIEMNCAHSSLFAMTFQLKPWKWMRL